MRPVTLALSLLVVVGCSTTQGSSEPTADPAVLTSGETFVGYLQSEGLILEGPVYTSTTTYIEPSALSGSILTYFVSSGIADDGATIQIFPFRDEATAEANVFAVAEARQVPSRGGRTVDSRSLNTDGTLRATGARRERVVKQTFQNESLVVVYFGRDATVRGALRDALGIAKRRR